MRFSTLIAVASLLALAACNKAGSANGDESANVSTTAADDSAAATAIPASAVNPSATGELPLTGQAFVDAMAASDQYEIQAAAIAQSKGLKGPWRDFAQMMTRDHTKSTQQLKAAVGKAQGVTLPDSPALTVDQQDQISTLQATAPDAFGKVYAQQQIAAHEKALQMLQTYAQSGDAKPLTDFALAASKVVQGHTEHARSLK